MVNTINSNSDLKLEYIALNTDTEKLDVGQICDYEFTIQWDEQSKNQSTGTATFEIELTYEQYTDTIEDKPSHDHGEGEIYTVFFDPNGGIVDKNSKSVILNKTYDELPIPERTEYTFIGWYTEIENGVEINSSSIHDKRENITLYARWNWNGHDYGEYEVATAALCLTDGEEIASCSTCGQTITRTILALGHDWGEYVTTKSATCQETGIKTRTCQREECNLSEEESIAKVGHSYTASCKTCSGKGYTDTSTSMKFCPSGNHFVTSTCSAHGGVGLVSGLTAYKVCTKCGYGSYAGTWRQLTNKGTGKQCKWCGVGYKKL